jgi:hypothetical protein
MNKLPPSSVFNPDAVLGNVSNHYKTTGVMMQNITIYRYIYIYIDTHTHTHTGGARHLH